MHRVMFSSYSNNYIDFFLLNNTKHGIKTTYRLE
jgi:hypothetical protein